MRYSLLNPPPEVLGALATVVAGLAAVRAQMNTLQAVEALLLHAGEQVAEAVVSATGAGSASGTSGNREMAYRMVQSEIGAALHESDRTVAGKMVRAGMLVGGYPAVYAALAAGRVTAAHAHAIVDAGLVISAPEARQQYEARVLAEVGAETVARLRPIAKRLAEHFAERTLEERHREANRTRCVRVVEQDDGMADLIALLPSIYAHGIKDRLDQIAFSAERARAQKGALGARSASAGSVADSAAASAASAASAVGSASVSVGQSAAGSGAACAEHFAAHPAVIDDRTRDQLRADAFTDLLLAGMGAADLPASQPAGDASIRARVQLVVPVARLRREGFSGTGAGAVSHSGSGSVSHTGSITRAGVARASVTAAPDDDIAALFGSKNLAEGLRVPGFEGPVVLEGVGPVGADLATRIAGHATSWDQVNVDAETGKVLSVETYQPSAAIRRYLGARDLHCRFPGCRIPIGRCDIDHTVDAAHGGKTSTDNLGALCRRHHTLKHATPWRVSQDEVGVYTWVSPTGLAHTDRPASRVRFTPVTVEPACHSGPGASGVGGGESAPTGAGPGAGAERHSYSESREKAVSQEKSAPRAATVSRECSGRWERSKPREHSGVQPQGWPESSAQVMPESGTWLMPVVGAEAEGGRAPFVVAASQAEPEFPAEPF